MNNLYLKVYRSLPRENFYWQVPLLRISNVSVDQQAIHFRVDAFYGDLETVKESSLGNLNFIAEPINLKKQTKYF